MGDGGKKFVEWIEAESLKASPWKNGGGTTKEIAIFPPGSSLDAGDFTWRLSSAEVTRSGPFSQFPDFERILTLVRGEELVLEFADLRKSLRPGTVVKFNGEEDITCYVPAGAVTDLGLIYDPDQTIAKFTVVELKSRPRSFSLTSPTVFLFVAKGETMISVFPGEISRTIGEGDVARIGALEEERIVFLDPGSESATIVAVEIGALEVQSN